jgi:hypothetical protein
MCLSLSLRHRSMVEWVDDCFEWSHKGRRTVAPNGTGERTIEPEAQEDD